MDDLSTKAFFNKYLRRSRPVLIKGMAKHWPGYQHWRNDSYLEEKAGDDQIEVEEIDRHSNEFAYFTKKYGRVKLTYSEFIQKIQDDDRKRNYYFAEQEVPVTLVDDIIEPKYGAEYLETRSVYYWDGMGTKSLPHQDDAENIMCVITGYKDFHVVSPFQSNFVYSGLKEGYPPNYSPCDFYVTDYKQCPLLKQARILTQRIEAGDCLFIPSHWWHQVNSSPERTIAISHWWRSHHPFITPLS